MISSRRMGRRRIGGADAGEAGGGFEEIRVGFEEGCLISQGRSFLAGG